MTMNMKNLQNNAYEILQLAEMLNTENTEYKEMCLLDMMKNNMIVGKYAHDCACRVAHFFEGRLCDKCYLDGWHAKKHRCNFPKISHKKTLNSQAAEQLWSRLDKFNFITQYSKAHFRCFLKHMCIWRNRNVTTLGTAHDLNPAMSKTKMSRVKRKRG